MAMNEIGKRNAPPAHRPADVFSVMRDEMDRMFERFEHGWPGVSGLLRRSEAGVMTPELDVSDNGKEIAIEVDLPGVEEKDVNVTLANGVLTIRGERRSEREEKKDNYYLAERSYGSFQRALRMPDTIDEESLEAHFDKGVLRIVARKRPDAVKGERRIEVRSGDKQPKELTESKDGKEGKASNESKARQA